MGRKVFAIIDVDDDKAIAEDKGTGEYLESEFGWLEQSGILLDEWLITDHDDECEWARYINYLIQWAFDNSHNSDDGVSPFSFEDWRGKPRYTWKDIVCINGEYYTEEFEISGDMDDETHYDISDFICAVANKHGVNTDDVLTYMMDDIDFNPQLMPYGAETCGCYINGKAEWIKEDDLK